MPCHYTPALAPWIPLLLAMSCGSSQEPAAPAQTEQPAPAAPAVDPELAATQALDEAQAGIGRAGKALKGRLQDAMTQGGPPAAVSACADEAMGLTALAAGNEGIRLGRASTRLRNPRNTGPDWVQAWLLAAEGSVAEGTDPAALEGVREVVDGPDGATAHVLVPILTEGVCLACHGAPEQLHPEVVAVLAERYPDDAATGYAPGQLRGAFWAEKTVD